MKHILQEHRLEYPMEYHGEQVLFCSGCGEWVSKEDHDEVIAEFKIEDCIARQSLS